MKERVKAGKWYDPGDGIRCVNGILRYLAEHPELGFHAVADDLEAMAKVLLKAKKERRRFRLIVS